MKFEVLTLLHTSDSCRLHFHLDVPLKKGVLVPAERRFEQVRVLREDKVNVLVIRSEKNIRDKFKNTETIPDNDINTSVDQIKRLIMAIKNNDLRYPEMKDGFFRHDVVLEFLKKLSNVFQWKIYESSTFGKDGLLSWYAFILCAWMEGNGLN